MEKNNIAPYDIRSKNGSMLVTAGSELTDAKRRLLNRHDWHIDAVPPFKMDMAMAKQYQRNYERALRLYSSLFNECVRTGSFSSSSLLTLAEIVSQFNNELPLFAFVKGTEMDYFTQTHSLNVAAICALIGYHLELTAPERKDIIAAGLIHDIGKTKVPKKILLAKRKLTPREFEIVQTHAELGADIIADHYSPEIVNAVKYHHVRIGRGYPENADYDSLPDLVKWVGTADVFEALTAERPYRRKMNPYKAIKVLCEEGAISSDFHITSSFSDIFSKMYIGAVVSLSNGTFGVIKSVAEENGSYYPTVETADGSLLVLSDDIEIRDVIGMS